MKSTIFYNALLRSIEKIYLRMSLAVLQKRMDGHHQQSFQGIRQHSHNIKSILLSCVDEIAGN